MLMLLFRGPHFENHWIKLTDAVANKLKMSMVFHGESLLLTQATVHSGAPGW